ncbi:MAG: hypothetical protein QXK24_08895 [Ignisphaera sp.]
MWCTPEDVRKELGLSVEDVSDADLDYYINKAQSDLLNDIAIYRHDEIMKGTIDGYNATFQTWFYPIIDSNFDKKVDPSDITVYKWKDAYNKETVAVSSINPEYGIIIVSTPPSTEYIFLTCSYYYVPTYGINYERLSRVTALLAAYYYIRSEMLLIPETWAHGAYRFTKGTPAEELLNEYYREKDLLLKKDYVKKKHGEVEFLRDTYGSA